MNLVGHGIDLVECGRIASILERHGKRFLARVLTEAEQQNARRFKDPVPHVAGRFAAKEAILKVLGTGWRGQINWTDIAIANDVLGQPQVTLAGHAQQVADSIGIARIVLSITHTRRYAAASAVGLAP